MPTGTHTGTPAEPRFASIPAALSHWAAHRPDEVAFTFVGAELKVEQHVTYRGLETSALKVAAALQATAARGERVLLLFPPGHDYLVAFLGCLYAGVVAVPLYLPRPGAKIDRIEAVVRSCRPTHALTTRELAEHLADLPRPEGPEGLRVHTIEDLSATDRQAYRPVATDGEELAFLQYTSGSTGAPKGVMVSHRNLAENEEAIADGFGVREGDVIVSWLPLYHDMGLIGAALLPLYMGLKSVLLNTFAFIYDPMIWPLAVAEFGATCSGGPNFAYQLLVDRYDSERLAGVDLRNWRIAFNGAEPIVENTLRAFTSVYREHGFDARAVYPCYGLAEATLFVSGAEPAAGYRAGTFGRRALEQGRLEPAEAGAVADDSVSVVSSGRPALRTEVVIRDTDGRAVPDGRVGEICVRSNGVAQGYWGEDQATERTFHARIEGHPGLFLRTGDLGALHDGELYPVGRMKDLLIIAGRNFYPHDIETVGSQATTHLRKGCAAAFQPVAEEPRVILVAEVKRTAVTLLRDDPQAFAAAGRDVIRAVGTECDLHLADVVFVYPGSIPKTSSGKIRRAETRARYLAGKLRVISRTAGSEPDATAPREAPTDMASLHLLEPGRRLEVVSAALRSMLAERWGGTPGEDDFAQPLAALGLDSLKLTALKASLERLLERPVDSRLFYGDRSLDEVARAIAELTAHAPAPTAAAAPRNAAEGPAADSQVHMQFSSLLLPEDTSNNLPIAVRLSRAYEPEQLRSALASVIARHPALRTVLGDPGTGTQVVREEPDLDWEWREFPAGEHAAVEDYLDTVAHRPFSLTDGPLVRGAAAITDGSTVLLLVCHHAVVDHWSLRAVFADILRGLPGIRLEGSETSSEHPVPTPLDWVHAQRERADASEGRLNAQTERWRPLRNHLLFPKKTSGSSGRNPAATIDLDIDAETTRRVDARSQARGRTPFVTLAAAYLHALYRVVGEKQIVIGVPHHGRTDWRFAGTVGYLVNMMPLQGDFRDGEGLDTLEDRTWGELRQALDCSDLPFARLVKALQPERHGQNPLFQATLTFQQSTDTSLEEGFSLPSSGCRQTLGDIDVSAVDIPPRDAAFALSLYGTRHEDRLVFRLVYQTDLVDESVAASVAREFRTSLDELTALSR
ncbi:AMP-binding protein [Streptomyces sp. NPDC054838]